MLPVSPNQVWICINSVTDFILLYAIFYILSLFGLCCGLFFRVFFFYFLFQRCWERLGVVFCLPELLCFTHAARLSSPALVGTWSILQFQYFIVPLVVQLVFSYDLALAVSYLPIVIEQLLDELLGQTSPSCQPLCHCALPGLPEYTTCKTVSFLPPPESKLTTSTSACCSSCSTNSPLIYSLFGIPFCVCYDILVRNVTKMINEIVLLHQTHIVCVAFTQQMICVQFHY